MTTVRIAHAEPRPGKRENGEFQTRGHLVVLADDAGHRAVPVWLRGEPGEDDLAQLVELAARPAEDLITADAPEELTARLLRAAGASVTRVDIDVTAAVICHQPSYPPSLPPARLLEERPVPATRASRRE
jgi:hypothetical protein